MNFKISLVILFFFQALFHLTYSQEKKLVGKIEGKIVDSETQTELIGANILIVNSTIGAATDVDGKYIIENVPIGNYSIKISFLGYDPIIKTDVIVRSERTTSVNGELKPKSIEADEVVVSASYFQKKEEQPLSSINFSREEIRRAPGSAGDVSRILMSLPSVAKVNDQSNTLAVRGGSPIENTFYIDNIEIPNINHFPAQGASGGPIGMINVDFIDDVDFFTGGFSAVYGNKLSSIMNLSFREGNHEKIEGQLDLNFSGFGGIIEGPLFSENATFMFSARRSYVEYLIKMVDVGSTVAPSYGDIQGKIVFDIDKNNKLMLLGVFGDDHMSSDQQNAIDNKMVFYGDQDIYQTTVGLNWRSLWSNKGYSNTSFSFNSMNFVEDFYETGTADLLISNNSNDMFYQFRNINYYQFNNQHSIKFGIEVKHILADYDNWYSEYTDAVGNPLESFTIDKTVGGNIVSAFGSYIFRPFSRLSLTFGARSDYFSYANELKFSPRFSLSYSFSDKTKLNLSTGLFYQSLPSRLLVSNEKNKNLNIPVSTHFIMGIEQLLTESTQLTFEVYQKNYSNFPMDPNQPGLFLIDEIYYNNGFFNTNDLVDNGDAQTQGAELTIQKKLAKDFYGLIGASYFHAKYKGVDNVWRDRIYDNRFIFSVEGGYKPNYFWEFSMRWIYAGGRPYTPFNIEESQKLNRGVLDENSINGERYDPYHSLNLRVDKRFAFSGSNLVLYLSIWNVYDRKNVASVYWDQIENKPEVVFQWGMLPIFGVEYEF